MHQQNYYHLIFVIRPSTFGTPGHKMDRDARYSRIKSCWFDQCIFEDWFFSLLVSTVKNKLRKKVGICDNLLSHILDVAYFKPLKSMWRQTLSDWQSTTYKAGFAAIGILIFNLKKIPDEEVEVEDNSMIEVLRKPT